MRLARAQNVGTVNVEVETTDSVDFTKTLQEIREQYESLVIKNKVELEKWFKTKVKIFKTKYKKLRDKDLSLVMSQDLICVFVFVKRSKPFRRRSSQLKRR